MIVNHYDLGHLYEYYTLYTKEKTQFVVLDEQDFHDKLIKGRVVFVSLDDQVNGFLSACIDKDRAYISLVYGEEKIVKKLIKHLEEHLKKSQIFELWIHFFNPVKLAWYPKIDVVHPGIQGLVLDSQMHRIYKDLDFKENSIQQTYYQDMTCFDISNYEINSDYHIDFFKAEKHNGLHDFACEIGVKVWHDEIMYNDKLKNPLPLIVALDQNRVIGFTGPIKVKSNSRGYFAGIGILQNYRRKGIGNALFLRLCQALKDIGAGYMTFFTGTENPARYIYLNAGFKVVESFVTMKKNIRS